jgi:flagellar hook-associated protein 2
VGVTPLTFTGTSQYASDFQSILTRAVGIANIPLQQLENQDQTDLSNKTQLGTLQSAVASLTSAVQALGTLASGQAISGNSSDSSVDFTATGATSPANYTVNSVTSLATSASETSISGFGDSTSTPVSTTGSLNLVVGSQTIPITLTSATNNLVGLQNAINNSGAGVTASILTTGNGNYLSVSANNLGATTLKLFDGAVSANDNVLTSANQGTDAVFQLNGLTVTRSGNTVNDLIPGATLTLEAKTSSPVSLSLAVDPSQLSSGIQNLVTAYNSVVQQVNGQTGTSGGGLTGNSVIIQLEGALRQLTNFQGSGSVQSLADLGIQLQSDGTMTFDQSVFSGLSDSQVAGALQFFGSATTGFGGLSQSLSAISDPITGSIVDEETTLTADDTKLQTQISNTSDQINAMQNNLLLQLSQADSLISSLSAQQSELTASIDSLNYVAFGSVQSSATA